MPPSLPQGSCTPCSPSPVPCVSDPAGPPGIEGPPGNNGANGTNGVNAFTTLTASFVQPAVSATVVASVVNGLWATVGQHVYVSSGGDYIVSARTASTITLQNTGETGNAAPTTVIASANTVSPSGFPGPDGSLTGSAGGDLTGSYPNPTLINTGITAGVSTKTTFDAKGRAVSLGSLVASDIPTINASTQLSGTLAIANGGTGQATALNAFNALSPLTTKGDILANNGTDDVRMPVGSNGQSLVANTLASNGVSYRNGYILLGSSTVNANVTTDSPIPIIATRYIVRKIIATSASISLTTVLGGVYTAASKGGSAIVDATQAYTALTTPTKFLDLTLQAPATTDSLTAAILYFSPSTPQGAAATLTIDIWGEMLA